MTPWYVIRNAHDVPSPALLIYPDRVEENLRRMLRMSGGPAGLRPHVKTHKCHQIARMQVGGDKSMGIVASTLPEVVQPSCKRAPESPPWMRRVPMRSTDGGLVANSNRCATLRLTVSLTSHTEYRWRPTKCMG